MTCGWDVFGYYVELWLGQLLFESVACLANESQQLQQDLVGIGQGLCALFTKTPTSEIKDLGDFLAYLRSEQRAVDHAINNCGLTGVLDITIKGKPRRSNFRWF